MGIHRRSGRAFAALLAAAFAQDAPAAVVAQPVARPAESRPKGDLLMAQLPPERDELGRYKGLHGAAARGDIGLIRQLISAGAPIEARDGHGRTPLMVAAYQRDHAAAKALIDGGADLGAFDNDRYDLLTISAVLNDLEMVKLAIAAGADATLITSPYEGTALIAAAHLGHVEVVQALIDGKAPLDHVNNIGWTALIEAIVLGDGGPRHAAIVRALTAVGANPNLPDTNGRTPLALARQRGYEEIADIVRRAGGRP